MSQQKKVKQKDSRFTTKFAEVCMWIAIIIAMGIYGVPELQQKYSIYKKETFISIDDKFVEYYYKGQLLIILNKKECKYLLIEENSRLIYNCGEGVEIIEEGNTIKK